MSSVLRLYRQTLRPPNSRATAIDVKMIPPAAPHADEHVSSVSSVLAHPQAGHAKGSSWLQVSMMMLEAAHLDWHVPHGDSTLVNPQAVQGEGQWKGQ